MRIKDLMSVKFATRVSLPKATLIHTRQPTQERNLIFVTSLDATRATQGLED